MTVAEILHTTLGFTILFLIYVICISLMNFFNEDVNSWTEFRNTMKKKDSYNCECIGIIF